MIHGSNHSTIFDNTAEHNRVVLDFFCPQQPRGLMPASRVRRRADPGRLRTVGWRDLFAINFTFFLNPVMYVLGAFAVVDGGLPLWWARGDDGRPGARLRGLVPWPSRASTTGSRPGRDAHDLGFWGARLLSSPYRVVAATYWFAAQALTAGLGIQAIYEAMTVTHLPLVPLALASPSSTPRSPCSAST